MSDQPGVEVCLGGTPTTVIREPSRFSSLGDELRHVKRGEAICPRCGRATSWTGSALAAHKAIR